MLAVRVMARPKYRPWTKVGSPVCRPMRTATVAPGGHDVAARRRCASTAAATAREAEPKTAVTLSPMRSTTTPPAASTASPIARSWPAITASASGPSSRTSVENATVSVRSSVSVADSSDEEGRSGRIRRVYDAWRAAGTRGYAAYSSAIDSTSSRIATPSSSSSGVIVSGGQTMTTFQCTIR